jgi:hypothetical protein
MGEEYVDEFLRGFVLLARRFIIGLIAVTVLLSPVASERALGFSSEQAGFTIKFKDEISPYRVIAVFSLPEEKIMIEAIPHDSHASYSFTARGGALRKIGRYRWLWKAPGERAVYEGKLIGQPGYHCITVNFFVMVPFTNLRGQYLNGYRIGKYPDTPLHFLPSHRPPRGFIEVTEENEDIMVSPHFTLKQFVCNQDGGFPKYVVLRERLVLKLEHILEEVNKHGYRCDTFHIMSGYRTPYYNELLGNVKHSMHLWGGAADIFIDETPRDGMMDDLNKDGRIDWRDAHILYNIIGNMYGRKSYKPFVGGLARYEKTACHGPFVHVDVRGKRARWGLK